MTSTEPRTPSVSPIRRTRVAILGGGPAGAVAALVLARAGLRTLVFESSPEASRKVGGTLATRFAPMLEQLELGEVVAQVARRSGFANRAYWGSNRPIDKDFLFTGRGSGWQLDRRRFEASLAHSAMAAGAQWLWDHRALEARREAGKWRIAFEGGEGRGVCEADFVIDATGRAAQFACAQGATRELFDQLVGVVVTLEAAAGRSSSMSLVESVPQGWWYSTPLANGGLTVAYLSDADLIDTQRLCDEAGWFDALDAAAQTRSRLAPWLVARDRPPLHPKVVHAGSACTSKMAGPDWLAVGDAAASFDPLSSQGIGWAMTTAYHGALAASKHLDGDPVSLDNYEGLARNLFADYQQQLAEHYAVERRWPDATFWSRRRASNSSALHVGR